MMKDYKTLTREEKEEVKTYAKSFIKTQFGYNPDIHNDEFFEDDSNLSTFYYSYFENVPNLSNRIVKKYEIDYKYNMSDYDGWSEDMYDDIYDSLPFEYVEYLDQFDDPRDILIEIVEFYDYSVRLSDVTSYIDMYKEDIEDNHPIA